MNTQPHLVRLRTPTNSNPDKVEIHTTEQTHKANHTYVLMPGEVNTESNKPTTNNKRRTPPQRPQPTTNKRSLRFDFVTHTGGNE